MTTTYSRFMLLCMLMLGLAQTGHTHDPGLSFANVQIENDTIRVMLSFAQADIEALIGIDSNPDAFRNQEASGSATTALKQLVRDGARLYVNGNTVITDNISVFSGPSETLQARLQYHYQPGDRISLAMPIIARFGRGHRMHLTSTDNENDLTQQIILNAKSDPVSISIQGEDPRVFMPYFIEGVWHIWIGFDHILFLVTLLLPAVLVLRNRQWETVNQLRPALLDTVKIVTAFTIAHSITLCLAVLAIVQLPSRLVESAIAFSVLVTAVNNLRPVFPSSRWLMAFGFGLVHGFGFANVLVELGLPSRALLMSLTGFNLGVEAGQIAIVVILIPILYLIRNTTIYYNWILRGGSTVAAIVALVWILERATGLEAAGF